MKDELEFLVILNDIDLMIDDLVKGNDAIEKELGFDVSRKEQLESERGKACPVEYREETSASVRPAPPARRPPAPGLPALDT